MLLERDAQSQVMDTWERVINDFTIVLMLLATYMYFFKLVLLICNRFIYMNNFLLFHSKTL